MQKITKKTTSFIFLFLVLQSISIALPKQGYFDFNSQNCIRVQQLIPQLQLQSAKEFLEKEKTQNPLNCAIHLLDNYIDYIEYFITEDEEIYKSQKTREKERINAIDIANPNSPYTLLSKAEIRVQWALLKLKNEDFLSAGLALKEAYSLLLKNHKRYPSFIPNFKILGWIEAISSTVPENYAWLVKMIGIKPNLDSGYEKLETFCTQADSTVPEFLKMEGMYSWCFINIHISKDKEKAISIAEEYFENMNGPLPLFMLATIYNTCNKNDKVIKKISKYRYKQGAIHLYTLDFLMGQALLRKQAKEAEVFLLNFYQKYTGKTNIKTATYYLSIIHHFQNNEKISKYYLNQTTSSGKAISEQDKQAVKEAVRGLPINKHLLRARLYFDGEYFELAYKEIVLASEVAQNSIDEKVEIIYRKARIVHSQNKVKNAIFLYQQTIQEGKELNRYFAANSALQLGLIYEEMREIEKATLWFNQVIIGFPKNTEYKNSLEQKARAGLSRIKKY